MCSLDWPLLLEFVKVLAAPTAAVIGACLVSTHALRIFRAQKTIERRLDWYERVYKAIDAFTMAVTAAHVRSDANEAEHATLRLHQCSTTLRIVCNEAYLYASVTGFAETGKLVRAVGEFHVATSQLVDAQARKKVTDVCNDVSIELARDIREEMGMKALH